MRLFNSNQKTKVINELRKSLAIANQKLKLWERITSDAIWDWDVKNNTIEWNEGGRTLFGYNDDSTCMTYSSWYENIHPSDKHETLQILQKAFDNQRPTWEVIYRFRCYNGTYKHTYNRGHILYELGVPVQITNAMRDIDERMTYVNEVEKLSLVASKTENLVIMTDCY
jgi:PAS domain S-box-containing protein